MNTTIAKSTATVKAQSVNWDSLNTYQRKAHTTRGRRQAAGAYDRPNKAQKAAYAKLLQRDGRKLLTVEEMWLLAGHPYLTVSQRVEFAEMAQAAIGTAVAA